MCSIKAIRRQDASRSGGFFYMVQQAQVGPDILIIQASRSHSGTPNSVGLLWVSDKADAETSSWQHTTFTTDRYHCPSGIRTRTPRKRAAGEPRLRQRGRQDWRLWRDGSTDYFSLTLCEDKCPETSSGLFACWERPVGAHWTGIWVSHIDGQDDVKKQIFSRPYCESHTPQWPSTP